MFYILDELGYQGPLILTILVAIQLLDKGQWVFFIFYLIGIWLNKDLNELLKSIIREPRPIPFDLQAAQLRDPLRGIRHWWYGSKELYISHSHLWGMPSGHAQTSSFVLVFYYLVREKSIQFGIKFNQNTLFFGGMCLLFFITLYQRFDSKAHSFTQLLMGTIVGALFAGMIFFSIKLWITETRKKRVNIYNNTNQVLI